MSKVANFSIDLPEASIAIQVSGTFGSRQEEAQRLGRVLRPKGDGRTAHFYTVVARDTVDADFAAHRQRFLAEQGYAYRIVDAGRHPAPDRAHRTHRPATPADRRLPGPVPRHQVQPGRPVGNGAVMSPRHDTVLLDVDGTLVDTTYHHALAWARAFRSLDVDVPLWEVHRAIGMGGDKLVAAVAGDEVEQRHGDDLRQRWLEEYEPLRAEVLPAARRRRPRPRC